SLPPSRLAHPPSVPTADVGRWIPAAPFRAAGPTLSEKPRPRVLTVRRHSVVSASCYRGGREREVEQVSALSPGDGGVRILGWAVRAGSRRSRPFHARGSAAHPGSAGWRAPRPRRPASRTPVRSLRRG